MEYNREGAKILSQYDDDHRAAEEEPYAQIDDVNDQHTRKVSVPW